MEHTGTVGIRPNHILPATLFHLGLGAGDAHHILGMYQPYFKLFRRAWLFKIENNRWLDCETGQQQKFRCKKHISIIIKTAVREILLFFITVSKYGAEISNNEMRQQCTNTVHNGVKAILN